MTPRRRKSTIPAPTPCCAVFPIDFSTFGLPEYAWVAVSASSLEFFSKEYGHFRWAIKSDQGENMKEQPRGPFRSKVIPRTLAAAALTTVVSLGISTTPATGATPGYVSSQSSSVAPGGTLSVAIHPTMYGATGDLAYYCGILQSGDTSNPSSSGWSSVLVLAGSAPVPIFIGATYVSGSSSSDLLFGGSGVGNFAPYDTLSQPLAADFTIPSDVPPGDYTAVVGCISPVFRAVAIDADDFGQNSFPLTVTGADAPGGPSDNLPNTGFSPLITAGVGLGAALVILVGAGLTWAKRRGSRHS
jgi:hypothetical protein